MTIYLYIKKHTETGLKYFGVTEKNPFKYKGSGVYWKNHIMKYGDDKIITLEVWGFDDINLCSNFAIKFSFENNIVNSQEWANQIYENGINKTPNVRGLKHTDQNKQILSQKMLGRLWWNNGIIQIRSEHSPGNDFVRGRLKFKRRPPSAETSLKRSNSLKANYLLKGLKPHNFGIPLNESQKKNLSDKRKGLVSCIDLSSGTRKVVEKNEFDNNPNLVGSTSKIGIAKIESIHQKSILVGF